MATTAELGSVMAQVLDALEREYSVAAANRAASFLPVGVTRETADRTLREARNQIDQLRVTSRLVLAGEAHFDAWAAWAELVHEQLAALSRFTSEWDMSSVLASVGSGVVQNLPKLGGELSDTLRWVAIGAVALVLLYGVRSLRAA